MEGNVGTYTFVLTDIEGSTPLWLAHRESMSRAMTRHNSLIEHVFAEFAADLLVPLKNTGDGVFAVFTNVGRAYQAAKKLRLALERETWHSDFALKIRMALHSGDTEYHDGDVQSITPAHATRLLSIGHGGQTLVSAATYALLQNLHKEGYTLLPLGSYLVRDWGEQEVPVYQLNFAELPALTFPPLKTQYPTNLPLRLSAFIGKEKEKQEVLEASHRLVTLTGIGGGGKTRLALETAKSLSDRREFQEGVYFVGLDSLPPARVQEEESPESELVAGAVVRELHIPEANGAAELQRLKDYLQSKTLLLVLDNCEHRVVECAKLVEELLTCCPHLSILATGWERLNVQGECLHEVKGLSLPPKRTAVSLNDVCGSEAVRLFEDRAKLVAPNFVVTADNAESVANICRTLDGIPFAIELAAANVQMLGVPQIEKRLFSLLENRSRPHHDRHRTLWTTLQWSLDLLFEPTVKPEGDLLLRLSAFSGGWTLEAAEQTCAGEQIAADDVLGLMHKLVNKSLVWVEDTMTGKRYRLPEVVRDYLHKKILTERQKEAFRQSHLRYFLAVAERAEPELNGIHRKEPVIELAAEQDNLRLAFHNAGAADRLRLAAASWRCWAWFSLREAESLLTAALLEIEDAPLDVVAKAHNALGAVLFQQGHYADAKKSLKTSLKMRTQLQDKAGRAETLFHLGNNAVCLKNLDQAAMHFKQSLALRRSLHDTQGIAAVLNSLGNLAWNRDDLNQARVYYTESWNLHRRLGDTAHSALLGCNLALISFGLNEYTHARSLYEANMELLKQGGNIWAFSQVLNNYAEVCYQLADYEAACTAAKHSYELLRTLDSGSEIAYPLETLGKIRRVSGDYSNALVLMAAASALCEADEPPANLAAEIATLREHFQPSEWERVWQQGQSLLPEKLTKIVFLTQCSTALL